MLFHMFLKRYSAKEPIAKPTATNYIDRFYGETPVMYNLRFGDYQCYLQRSKLSIQIDTIQMVCDFVNTERAA